jgi:hypothetical protein
MTTNDGQTPDVENKLLTSTSCYVAPTDNSFNDMSMCAGNGSFAADDMVMSSTCENSYTGKPDVGGRFASKKDPTFIQRLMGGGSGSQLSSQSGSDSEAYNSDFSGHSGSSRSSRRSRKKSYKESLDYLFAQGVQVKQLPSDDDF